MSIIHRLTHLPPAPRICVSELGLALVQIRFRPPSIPPPHPNDSFLGTSINQLKWVLLADKISIYKKSRWGLLVSECGFQWNTVLWWGLTKCESQYWHYGARWTRHPLLFQKCIVHQLARLVYVFEFAALSYLCSRCQRKSDTNQTQCTWCQAI